MAAALYLRKVPVATPLSVIAGSANGAPGWAPNFSALLPAGFFRGNPLSTNPVGGVNNVLCGGVLLEEGQLPSVPSGKDVA